MQNKKLILIPAAIIPFAASIFYFNLFNERPEARIIYLLTKVFILVYPLFFISITDDMKKAFKINFQELGIGTAIGAAIFLVGYVILKIPMMYGIISAAAPFVQAKAISMGVINHYIEMALIVSFIHSMLEEYYWRWFLFGGSRALALSATAFSLHHFVVLSFYYDWFTALVLTFLVFIGGVIFNLLYERKNNVWGAWAAHVGADLLIFYTGYILLNGGF